MNKKLLISLLSAVLGVGLSIERAQAEDFPTDPAIFKSIVGMDIPVVVINCVDDEEPTCEPADPPEGAWGVGIKNAVKVPASMQIILRGDTLYDSGDYVKKVSGLTVKVRGNGSGRNPKKSFKLKLQKKEDLLMREDTKYRDKDWVLLRNAASLVSPVGFWTSELIGQEWTPAHRIVNVWMNGSYRGLYILCEQVKAASGSRIEVDEKEGYVVEADAYWWTEDSYFPSTLTAPQLKFTYKYPDPEDLTEEWHEKVSTDVVSNEARIADGSFDEVYDCDSFARWLVGWDLLGNTDCAGSNMYIVRKDGLSKIEMGPMWDFDSAFTLEDDWIGLHYQWFYYHYLLKSDNPSFREAYIDVWKRNGRESVEILKQRINSFADSPEGESYQKSLWLQNRYNIPADWNQPHIGSLEFMRQYVTDYLDRRADWIDAHIEEVLGVDSVGKVEDGNCKTFDLLGRPVSPESPGIKIMGRRKIIKLP